MINVLNILFDIAHLSGDYAVLENDFAKKAQAAVDKGIACILKAQYKWNSQLTAWAAQYDHQSLTPGKRGLMNYLHWPVVNPAISQNS